MDEMNSEMEQVICYSGHEYAERPISLYWDGEWHEIERIIARWRTPGERHFRVVTETNQGFLLTFDEFQDIWRVEETS